MIDKLDKVKKHYDDVARKLSDPEIIQQNDLYRDLAKEESELSPIVRKYQDYQKILSHIDSAKEVLREDDIDIRELAENELEILESRKHSLEEEIKMLLVPKDPKDKRNAIIEIRAGTGGDEAGLFAGDLFRMYQHFAESHKWKLEVMSSNPQGIGGFREIIFMLSGDEVYGIMKYEAGVHRVQRVPTTETGGRIHTSAASVAVLPEAKEVDVKIDPNDVRIDVYRSSGPGGQSVNTTDSAVRLTHIPTGLVVTCQDEKSQHKNRAKAFKVLRARLYEKAMAEEHAKLTAERRSMVSTGDRSAKIRTYNFPQGRVTDHRINLSLYNLNEILGGDLSEFIDQLKLTDRAEKLKELE